MAKNTSRQDNSLCLTKAEMGRVNAFLRKHGEMPKKKGCVTNPYGKSHKRKDYICSRKKEE